MKSMRRLIKDCFQRGESVKAVVIGAKGSGKTSLLVSLYSNLLKGSVNGKFDPSQGKWDVRPFESCEEELPPGVQQFDFEGARREMKNGDFPDSTTDWSVMKLRGFLNSKRENGGKWVTLEILDLPGERVADFIMVNRETKSLRSFRDWSRVVKDAYDCPDEFKGYLDLVRKIDLERADATETILGHYRDLISKLHEKKSLFFTPSTIRLGENGKLLIPGAGCRQFEEVRRTLQEDNPFFTEKRGREFSNFVQEIQKRLDTHEQLNVDDRLTVDASALESDIKRIFETHKDIPVCFESIDSNRTLKVRVDFRKMLEYSPLGLSDAEFAPLPEEAFGKDKKKWAKIVNQFSKAYKQYYKKIVEPLIDWCKDVDQLYYLVDVLGILHNGRDAYDYESGFGRRVIEIFKKTYSRAVWGGITDKIPRWSVSSLKKACLIATQADKAAETTNDEGEKNIKALAEGLHLSTIQRAIGVNFKDRDVPVIVCAAISSEKKPCEAKIPDAWPSTQDAWDVDKYDFKRTKNCPACDIRSTSVGNFHLDAVAKEMLNV